MPFSVNGLLSDAQIALEKAGTDAFGTVLEDFVRGPRSNPGRPDDSQSDNTNRNDGSWYATSYAAALSGGTSYRPKLKFLFKVEFIFTEAAKNAFPDVFSGAKANEFEFMIKSVDRPKVDFEYEEDVNMYNFRTKALKKIRHRDLTVTFMDDIGNRVFTFFRTLMMIHQPISRRQTVRDLTLDKPISNSVGLGSGMQFSQNGQSFHDNAHRGVVNSQFGNSIEAIRVKQIFVDPQAGVETAVKMVSFDFMNPRIMSFDFDELSHEANDVSALTMVFDYDWMEMVNIGALGTASTPFFSTQGNIAVPGVHGAPSDIHPFSVSGAPSSNGSGGGNALLGQLSGILGKGSAQLTSDIIGKSIRSVAGNGRFATAISGVATSTFSGPISGIIGGASRDILSGAISSASNSIARARGATIIDSSTTGADRPIASVFSSNAYAGTGSVSLDGFSTDPTGGS
jgi:hypothetical protein